MAELHPVQLTENIKHQKWLSTQQDKLINYLELKQGKQNLGLQLTLPAIEIIK